MDQTPENTNAQPEVPASDAQSRSNDVAPTDENPAHEDGVAFEESPSHTDPSTEPVEGSPETAPAEPVQWDGIEAEGVVEAILFASDSPLSAARIAQIMGVGDAKSVRKDIEALNARYENHANSFRIEEIAGGFQMFTLGKFKPWLDKFLHTRQESRLSPAAMETLAIIAYKQPVLRAEVESIRGVSVGEVLNRLREMNLIKIVGRDEQIGRPILYGTTKRFLEVFGLGGLKDLPSVEELKAPA